MNSDPKERGRAPYKRSASRTRTLTRDEASAEHRRKLEALFGGGGDADSSPAEASRQDAGPVARPQSARPVYASPRKSLGRSPSEYRLRLERLRIAREDEEIREAANTFLAYHQLPDDIDVLYKLLRHPEEKVQREAMGQISSLLMQGRISSTILLEDRLKELAAKATEPSTRSYIDGIKAQVDQLKAKNGL